MTDTDVEPEAPAEAGHARLPKAREDRLEAHAHEADHAETLGGCAERREAPDVGLVQRGAAVMLEHCGVAFGPPADPSRAGVDGVLGQLVDVHPRVRYVGRQHFLDGYARPLAELLFVIPSDPVHDCPAVCIGCQRVVLHRSKHLPRTPMHITGRRRTEGSRSGRSRPPTHQGLSRKTADAPESDDRLPGRDSAPPRTPGPTTRTTHTGRHREDGVPTVPPVLHRPPNHKDSAQATAVSLASMSAARTAHRPNVNTTEQSVPHSRSARGVGPTGLALAFPPRR